jgi:hypothetical protein
MMTEDFSLLCTRLPDNEIKLRPCKHQYSEQSGHSAVQNRCKHVLQGKHRPAVLVANGRQEGLCNDKS